ncbi:MULTISPECIES: YchO/YchP family invasin [Kosakonia]|uniref:YchO/YchP family invasin n=1 Tax=Kosakonia TaxID=1330547 RepID=UPI0008D2ACE1|nr:MULTISPECIES: YchO/YchP family invasin [Kosakonia]MDD7995640.1 YchO/YchP family invasin [Kosakonia radicincitans]NCF06712.1 YchO/YchP family invasin [Kosakonia sp. MH5]PTA91938.1 invasin [Kosakonia sp. H7A]SES86429.1 Invasin beta-domain of outer membrane [Kosakonia radicincitans]
MNYKVSSLLILLLAGDVVDAAQNSFVQQAENPFDNDGDGLPDLGMAPENGAQEKHVAEMVKAFGEASMTDNGLTAGEQARQFAFGQLRDVVSDEVNQKVESWLSPWGSANIDFKVDNEGSFTGSHGDWFVPLQDNNRYLSWGQLGVTQQDQGLVGNVGLGQRWIAGDWLLGYNTFYDTLLDDNYSRAGLGAEAWGEYLRFSANYYQPVSSWNYQTATQQQRMARGYDVTAQARLPFWQQLNTSLSVEQYFGENVDLFDTGTGYHNPVAVKVGLNYTPVPLVTLTAEHRQGESGLSQNDLGLKLNYRFGVPLWKQLSASEVAASRSLRGSRYDSPTRNSTPVYEYRQRKTLSVFLATPPWDLQPGETVALKLQINSTHGVRSISWQGDTQALSLTPPANGRSADGWTLIMPRWDSDEGASNHWTLTALVEDDKGQRVASNTIELKLTEPVVPPMTDDNANAGWSLPAP